MRTIRILVVAALAAVLTFGVASPAGASRCTQYPYFIQPIICRL